MIFEELKKGFKSSLKGEGHHIIDDIEIKNFMLITDGLDDSKERLNSAITWNEKLNSKLTSIFLYDITSYLHHENSDQGWIIDVLKEHSTHIRSLKEDGFVILLDPTVREFLVEFRGLRSITQIEIETLSLEEVEALTNFFTKSQNREKNFISHIIEMFHQIIPELIYWKPPFLRDRHFNQKNSAINNFSLNLLKELPINTMVFLEGLFPFQKVENITGLLFGGQSEGEITRLIHRTKIIFKDVRNLTILVHIDDYEHNLAKMGVIQTFEAFVQSGKIPEDSNLEITNEMVNSLLEEKYGSIIENLQFQDLLIKYVISFGDIKTLQLKFQDLKPECSVISLKSDGSKDFIDRIITKANLALSLGISVLIV